MKPITAETAHGACISIFLEASLSLLPGCDLIHNTNPNLDKSAVEVRGDTAVYTGHYRNGGVRSEITLVNGLANGTARLFFANGTVEEKSGYRNGG